MRAIVAIASCALLAACGGKSDDGQKMAGGQVLEGTISDAMLPLEAVQSEPPRAKVTASPGAGASASDAEDGDAAADDEAAEAPTAEASAPAPAAAADED